MITPRSAPIKYENVVETVIIGSKRFQVPEPWAGNRLFPTARNLDELKQIPEDSTYKHSELFILAEAYEPLLNMLQQARLDGIELTVESAYRSIHYQTRIFLRMLEQGRSFEDIIRYVAPPGYSQHMLGTAMDFSPSNWEFAETEQYRWLQENGPRFGFEETYSEYNRYNMPWEAWHWNYVGVSDAMADTVAEKNSDSENEAEFAN
ncbi:MAG: M15 family metallopeptidase [Desulfofustis sp.]